VYTDSGRERSGIDVVEWAQQGVELGAGEILVTSIDREGTRKGYDVGLTKALAKVCEVPIISSGGYGEPDHVSQIVSAGADAISVADALHYNRISVTELRRQISKRNIPVRKVND